MATEAIQATDAAPEQPAPAEAPSGKNVGEVIYEQVQKLTTTGKKPLSKTEAFKKVAQDSGRREGTVAANYYRVARQRGEGRTEAPRPRVRTDARLSPERQAIADAILALQSADRALRTREREFEEFKARVASLVG